MHEVEYIVFLDRDGTITREKGVINHPLRLELEPLAGRAIANLNRVGIPTVMVTNQPGIGRGWISDTLLAETHSRLTDLLAVEGAKLDGLYVCPHLPSEDGSLACTCHKPLPGLINQALADLQIAPKKIYVVGDRREDVALAKCVGGCGILVKTGYGLGEWELHSSEFPSQPDFVAENLDDAVRWILLENDAQDINSLPVPQYEWPPIDTDVESSVIHQLYETISIGDNSGSIGALERGWEKTTGRKYAVSFSSGTMALYAAYRALGIHSGDEVILPAYGFFATASPLLSLGAIPIFIDVDETGNLDPKCLEKLIGPRTRAIVVSHIFGAPADLVTIQSIANSHNIPLVEDASHALGAQRNGIRAGTSGIVSIFSLQAKKQCPAGEGGILVTDDEDLAARATMTGHFKQRNLNAITSKNPLFPYHITGAGLKLRMHPLAASIGCGMLKKFPLIQTGRVQCAKVMWDILKQYPGLSLLAPLSELSLYNLPLLLPNRLISKRNELLDSLVNQGFTHFFRDNLVGTIPNMGIFQNPQALHPDYPRTFDQKKISKWPKSDEIGQRILLLPLWHKTLDFPIAIRYAQVLVESLILMQSEASHD